MPHEFGELTGISRKLDAVLEAIKEQGSMANAAQQLTAIIAALNDNTNAVATRMEKLIEELQLAAVAEKPISADQFHTLQSIADHLKQLGADPANPVPPAFPAGSPDAKVAPPAASTEGPHGQSSSPQAAG